MNRFFSTLTAFGAGMLAMYYFDEQNGRRRRAELRDWALSGTRTTMLRSRKEARHVANQARGVLATGHLDRTSRRPPEDDRQLHERIRANMGHVVRHPGAIDVRVENAGEVTLTGHILRSETRSLLDCVREMPGVTRLDNQLTEHEHPDHVPNLQGTGRRAPSGQQSTSAPGQSQTAARH